MVAVQGPDTERSTIHTYIHGPMADPCDDYRTSFWALTVVTVTIYYICLATPCNQTENYKLQGHSCYLHIHPEDGGSTLLRKSLNI
jgi:hypothetical protein